MPDKTLKQMLNEALREPLNQLLDEVLDAQDIRCPTCGRMPAEPEPEKDLELTGVNTFGVLEAECEEASVSIDDVRSVKRTNELVAVRRKVARTLSAYGVDRSEIGKLLNRDPSSVTHLINYG